MINKKLLKRSVKTSDKNASRDNENKNLLIIEEKRNNLRKKIQFGLIIIIL